MRRGRRERPLGWQQPRGPAPCWLRWIVVRLALRFASRASVDSVQFLDSVHSVTGQALEWADRCSDDRSGSEKLTA